MRTLVRDLVYALRRLRSARVFTATAVLTLALGIGGTTAIFTLIHAVMLKSLPVSDPSRLYRIGDGDSCCVQGGPQDRWGMFSFPLFERLQASLPEFEALTAFQAGMNRMGVRRPGVDDAPRPLRAIYVTGNYFTTLGVGPFAGRVFSTADDRPEAAPVVVLAYHAWQGVYGGDTSLVGSALVVEGQAFTVAGVAPPGFFGETLRADPPDIWVPLQHEPLIAGAETSLLQQVIPSWLRVIGRLRPEASVAGIDARLTGLLRLWMQHEAGYPANWMPEIERVLPEQVIAVVPAGAGVGVMKEQYGRSLQILLGVCGLVLLIACANVANLMLARAVARRGETALRLAMGASRRQIVTEALVESVVLALGGALAGLLVAMGAARLLLSLAFAGADLLPIETTPSPLVLAFATGLAVATGLVFGAAPAWFATRTDPIDALRGAARTAGDRASFARKALLVLQATLSVVLVAGSTMLGRSLGNLEGQDFGFDRDGRVLVSVGRPSASFIGERLTALYRDVEERLSSIPGVEGAGLALYNPLTNNWGEGILIAGKPPPAPGAETGASWDRVSAGYLQQLGVKLVSGRHFSAADNETAENVAVVNEAFVRRFFEPDEDPIDQHFGLNLPENVNAFRIVGVVGDARFAAFELDRPVRPMFFVPLAQTVEYAHPAMRRVETASHYVGGLLLVTRMPPGVLEPQVARVLAEADRNLAVVNEAFVRRFFEPDEDPIDQHFGLNLPENVNAFRIVGVVGDARFAAFEMDRPVRPTFFVPLAQTVDYANPMMRRVETASHYAGGLLLVTRMPPGVLEPQVARVLAEADPNLAVISVRTLQEQVDRTFDQQRAVASLAGLFGIIALVLAAIGLYGVTAYSVARRTSEIGVRMALGADRGRVMSLVLGGAFRRVAVGLVLGLPLAVGAGYVLSAQLYGVSFWDPVALGVASAALGVAAFVASVVPAARAAALAPITALRIE